MGRELQKRKRRSSRPTIRQPIRRKKQLNPAGNGIIAQNWNKKETLSQNYSRFGIVARLGNVSGGVAKNVTNPNATVNTAKPPVNPLAIKSADHGHLKVEEVKVERDANGKIVRVLRRDNPLNDPLAKFDEPSDVESEGSQHSESEDEEMEEEVERPAVLRELEAAAAVPVVSHARHQSQRETEWLQRLVAKYGGDLGAMARDRKLNPMQQTAGDLKRRLQKAGLLQA
ncbi:ribosome biogenesis protein Nop16 [Diplogelasinospora grovesii]|uniref:Nucleolar protein 16 n=1 Tax=Diplogelasinospora grovesii TaxID=303347 RepID=A0AAN6NGI8_9PEZI|nr:ribosome biogenesis protein Nop16 [Diplogelasinospora grovesii]